MVERAKADRWMDAAKAIMTTDTYPKVATRAVKAWRLALLVINGIAKGAGMIAPDMATMRLSYHNRQFSAFLSIFL